MFLNVVPVLKKRPDYLITHAETYNVTNHTSKEFLNKVLKLKNVVYERHQFFQIYLSTPVIRAHLAKAVSVVASLRD